MEKITEIQQKAKIMQNENTSIWYQNKTYLGSMSQKDFVYLNHK